MTVLLGAISDEGVVLAADTMVTRRSTGEVISVNECKITQFSPTVAIASCGSSAVVYDCFETIRAEIRANNLDINHVNDFIGCLLTRLQAIPHIYPDSEISKMYAGFLVAGPDRAGELSLTKVEADGHYWFDRLSGKVQFTCMPPSDLEFADVQSCFMKAATALSQESPDVCLEEILQKTILLVSQESATVSELADVWTLRADRREGHLELHDASQL